MLKNVYKYAEIKSRLLRVTDNNLESQTGKRHNETRVDVRSTGFWARSQQAFTDKRIFDTNANRYHSHNVILKTKEKRKEHTMKEYYNMNMAASHH